MYAYVTAAAIQLRKLASYLFSDSNVHEDTNPESLLLYLYYAYLMTWRVKG